MIYLTDNTIILYNMNYKYYYNRVYLLKRGEKIIDTSSVSKIIRYKQMEEGDKRNEKKTT